MNKKLKGTSQRPCARCGTPAPRLYRVRARDDAPWQLVCHVCWPEFKASSAKYTYGGTWTARDRG
ncbi:MAG: hypothetical protein SFY95_08640 [Planctomycetota bacterium]|nr:hypothetical protein [Planctomycetota bacterium]